MAPVDQASYKLLLDKCITAQYRTNVTATSNDKAHSSPNTHFHICSSTYVPSLWYETVMEGLPRQSNKYFLRPRLLLLQIMHIHGACCSRAMTFPDNTRTVVIQTYCQQCATSNIIPSVCCRTILDGCVAIKSETHSGDLWRALFPLVLCGKTYKLDI